VELLVLDSFLLRFGLSSCFEGQRVILDQLFGILGFRCVEVSDLNWPLKIGQWVENDPGARELLPENLILTCYGIKLWLIKSMPQ
jgi:hypothetical protein